jgi:hypothetical protein
MDTTDAAAADRQNNMRSSGVDDVGVAQEQITQTGISMGGTSCKKKV